MKRLVICLLVAILSVCFSLNAQRVALRTNLMGLATGNINLEGSLFVNSRLSLHLPIQAKPFSYPLPVPVGLLRWMEFGGENSYIDQLGTVAHTENVTILPGIRYWSSSVYNRGFFVGLYAIGSWFRWGGDKYDPNYREGWSAGLGGSIGYSMELSPRWNIETEVGLGGVSRAYNHIKHTTNEAYRSDKDIILTIPKIGISLVYIIR